jgi:hypothetical protein
MEGYLKYFREHCEGYIVGTVVLALLFWIEHLHAERVNGIIDCVMHSYEDVNDTIRSGFAQPDEHQYYFEDAFNECTENFIPSLDDQ